MSVARSRLKLVSLLIILMILSSFYAFHSIHMWQKATTLSSDASTALSVRVEAAEWLSERLKQNETALVSLPEVYYALNPELRDKLVDYHSLWNLAGVKIRSRAYKEQVLRVRRYFIDYLRDNPQVKYAVRDWGDAYSTYLYGVTDNDELMFLLSEVETFPFVLSTGWSNKITIYEIVKYATLFYMDLSFPPKQFSIYPRDTPIQYDYISMSGVTIQKVGPSVGFYLPLEAGINATKQNYLTMRIKLDAEDQDLLIGFYYDKNRDGRFSGYEIDYTKSVRFNQSQQGWLTGTWYKIYQEIPKAHDPVVQIVISMRGDKDGAITLSDLVVYTEITPDLVLIEAANWLSGNLKEDELALAPTPAMFSIAKPELSYKLVPYSSLWASANISFLAGLTNEDVLEVRRYFVDFMKGNSSAKYVVRDWVNPYAERLFEAMVNDELMFLLREVKAMFYMLEGGLSRKITIYERVQYTTLFTMNFSTRPEGSFISPHNVSITFHSNGTTIQKVSPSVGFYIPLEVAINASKENYFTMQFKLDAEDQDLLIGFYYDKNRDGRFSGYEIDYTKSVRFNQTQKGWVKGEWYKIAEAIPKSEDPVVQIVISMRGDKDGAITLANFVVHTEITSGG